MNGIWLRALGALRIGRLTREIAGLRRAAEALVELKAFELGMPNPLAPAVRKLRKDAEEAPPTVERIEDNAGNYVLADQRRQAYEQARGRTAPLDEDFMGAPAEDARGDQTARAVSTTIYPEERRGITFGPET